MIVHGGALERARALDLGADDVISFPLSRWNLWLGSGRSFGRDNQRWSSKQSLHDALAKERLAETGR